MSPDGTLQVMLVEDSIDDVFLIEHAFTRASAGVETRVAQTVPDALDLLRGQPSARVDLLLLDLNLPGPSGFELLRALQSEPDLRPAHVAVLTSSSLEMDRVRADELGADGFLTKPTRFDDLVEILEGVLRALHLGR